MKKECAFCLMSIDLKKDKFILLGTYNGQKTLEEKYYHDQCFKLFFEKNVKKKAQNIVNTMQRKIMPMAKDMMARAFGMAS